MRMLAKLLLTTLAGVVVLPVSAGTPINQTRPLDARGRVEIENVKGRVEVVAWDRPEVKLTGTLAGLVLVYLAPPATALFAWGPSQMAGWIACAGMVIAMQPILRYYRLSPLWGFALPIIAAFYAAFTLDSALQYWRGKGGMWKGRAQAAARSET